jgi:hypothetical protein
MSEPSTTEGRRIHGEIKGLLECAAVQQAESSASRLREPASEQRARPSLLEREASVHPEPSKEKSLAVKTVSSLADRTMVFMTVSADGYTTTTDDMSCMATTLGEVFMIVSRAIRRVPFPAQFRGPTTITKYSG